MNKDEELKFTKFFINWFNRKYNYDYFAISNVDEAKTNTEIDIYAKSKSGNFQGLNFQLTTSEGGHLKEFAKLRNISKKTGKNIVMGELKNGDDENWIKKAIENKYYSEEVKQSLILLIQKELGPLFDEKYFKEIFKNIKSNFRAIYLVHYPSFKENSSHSHSGQILAIKEFRIKK